MLATTSDDHRIVDIVPAQHTSSIGPVFPPEVLQLVVSHIPAPYTREDQKALSACALSSIVMCGPARKKRFQGLSFEFREESPISVDPILEGIASFLRLLSSQGTGETYRLVPILRLVTDFNLSFEDVPVPEEYEIGDIPPMDTKDVVDLLGLMRGEDFGIQSFRFLLPSSWDDHPFASWRSFSQEFKQAFWNLIESEHLVKAELYHVEHLPSNLLYSSAISHLVLVGVAFQSLDDTQMYETILCKDTGQYPKLETVELIVSTLPLPSELDHFSGGRTGLPFRSLKSLQSGRLTFEEIDQILQTNDGSLEKLEITDDRHELYFSLPPIDFPKFSRLTRLSFSLADGTWDTTLDHTHDFPQILHVLSKIPLSGAPALRQLVISRITVKLFSASDPENVAPILVENVFDDSLALWHALDAFLVEAYCPKLRFVDLGIHLVIQSAGGGDDATDDEDEPYGDLTGGVKEQLARLFPRASERDDVMISACTYAYTRL